MPPQQFTMDLMPPPSLSRDDFVLGACNALAADWIDRWPDWPGRIKGVVLYGPADCGKSHLAAIWQNRSQAMVMSHLDDQSIDALVDQQAVIWDHPKPNDDWPEDLVFHWLNRLTEINGSLLVLSRLPMPQLDWQLADVASRLNGLSSASISDPDDAMLASLLHKHADDMGLALDADVTRYIVSRMERQSLVARQIIKQLNDLAMASKKPVTLPMVREVFEQQLPLLGRDHNE